MGAQTVFRQAVTGEKLELHPVDAKWRLQEKVIYEWIDFPWSVEPLIPKPRNTAKALVVGTGPTARADLSLVDPSTFEVFCVNKSIFFRELRPDHMITWHAENLEGWLERFEHERADIPRPAVHSGRESKEVDFHWKWGNPHGSSALLAVGAALSIGYQEVVVAGCPLSGRCEGYRRGWLDHRWMLDRVFGMSGWIADEFGKWEA